MGIRKKEKILCYKLIARANNFKAFYSREFVVVPGYNMKIKHFQKCLANLPTTFKCFFSAHSTGKELCENKSFFKS